MLKKDLLELCLLHLLAAKDCYGYEMLSRLHGAFPDTQESAIYAVLRGLCKSGCTESYQGAVSGGPSRKYYRLTSSGQEVYSRLLVQWRAVRDAVALLGIE